MSAFELLDTLTASGVHVWAEGGKLKLDAPRGAVTPELKERLAAHKPELLAALSADDCPASPFTTPEGRAALRRGVRDRGRDHRPVRGWGGSRPASAYAHAAPYPEGRER
jgi:hypothetical protein